MFPLCVLLAFLISFWNCLLFGSSLRFFSSSFIVVVFRWLPPICITLSILNWYTIYEMAKVEQFNQSNRTRESDREFVAEQRTRDAKHAKIPTETVFLRASELFGFWSQSFVSEKNDERRTYSPPLKCLALNWQNGGDNLNTENLLRWIESFNWNWACSINGPEINCTYGVPVDNMYWRVCAPNKDGNVFDSFNGIWFRRKCMVCSRRMNRWMGAHTGWWV